MTKPMSKETLQRAVSLYAEYGTQESAAAVAGVSRNTFQSWLREAKRKGVTAVAGRVAGENPKQAIRNLIMKHPTKLKDIMSGVKMGVGEVLDVIEELKAEGVNDAAQACRVAADLVQQAARLYQGAYAGNVCHVLANVLHQRQVAILGEVAQARCNVLAPFQHGGMRPAVRPCEPFAGFLVTAYYGQTKQVIQAAAVNPHINHFGAV